MSSKVWDVEAGFTRWTLCLHLDELFQKEYARHYAAAPHNGIPVGGGDWMDTFFRCEALRGCLGALRRGSSLAKAIEEGKTVSSISVSIWNNSRKKEYQVHRWEQTAWDFLERAVWGFKQRLQNSLARKRNEHSC